eukprot:PITA_07585
MGVCEEKLKRVMPHLSQVVVQAAYAGMYILNKVALQHGMNHFVFVTYRQTIATLAVAPLAYVLERHIILAIIPANMPSIYDFCRHQRPPMTLSIFSQIFFLALCGITISQNFCLAGLHYTNSTFSSAILNLIPPITFVMATSLRLENVHIKSKRGQAKVVGIIISVGGAMVMTLYKGPEIKILRFNLNAYDSKASNTVLGSMLLLGGVVSWAAWIIFQAPVVREYPAQLSLTALMCFLGALQSGVIALVYAHKTSSVWVVGWNIELLSYVYSGLMCSAFAIFVQAWCIHKKGPVFVAIFDPVCTVVAAILQYFVLHDNLNTGCVVGAVLIVLGLYPVLWGKAGDYKKECPTEVACSRENTVKVEDSRDMDTTLDISRPLLQNQLH